MKERLFWNICGGTELVSVEGKSSEKVRISKSPSSSKSKTVLAEQSSDNKTSVLKEMFWCEYSCPK